MTNCSLVIVYYTASMMTLCQRDHMNKFIFFAGDCRGVMCGVQTRVLGGQGVQKRLPCRAPIRLQQCSNGSTFTAGKRPKQKHTQATPPSHPRTQQTATCVAAVLCYHALHDVAHDLERALRHLPSARMSSTKVTLKGVGRLCRCKANAETENLIHVRINTQSPQ